ncbi:hypothetical protein ACQ3G6_09750 [Allorhizobium undicola]|uniref:hypothetical protein n=1 Tax=Allorhizobium undicola TaxID=78527 RepID=UPI003D350CBF
MPKFSKLTLALFVALLSLTMVGEGMITVTLLWTSASIGQSPLFIGTVLFVMNLVPFVAQLFFKPMRRAIADRPVAMIVLPRMCGVLITLFAGFTFSDTGLLSLIVVASCLTFITFISQQCIETLMGQLTVSGALDAQTSARLSQTALQTGVFVGNATAGLLIAHFGTAYVFFGIAASFASSVLLLFVAPAFHIENTPAPVAQTAQRTSITATADIGLWFLLIGMGILAVQLSGFNFFVPLIYEGRAGESAAVYGTVSAAAGVGALFATFIRSGNKTSLGYLACIAVVAGDVIVTQDLPFLYVAIAAFCIGFGFNMSRIRLRQAIFERLSSKEESAAWGGRVTLVFRSVTAGAPLAFGLLITNTATFLDNSIAFAAIGILAMGIGVPMTLLMSNQKKRSPIHAH